MSVSVENTADAPEARDSELAVEPITGFSPDMIEEKIKVKFEPLNAQISALTQLLNQLIQGNSERNSPTTGFRNYCTQPEP